MLIFLIDISFWPLIFSIILPVFIHIIHWEVLYTGGVNGALVYSRTGDVGKKQKFTRSFLKVTFWERIFLWDKLWRTVLIIQELPAHV